MTLVTIDVSDVASETHPDDRVIFWAPRHRPGTHTAKHSERLVGGVGEVELKPGPTMVQFQCRGIADTEPKLGTVPESGTVTLADVLDSAWEYSPEVVRAAQQARDEAVAGAERVGSAERVLEAEATVTGIASALPNTVGREVNQQVPPAVTNALTAAGASMRSGTGFPEGKVAAPVGAVYTDTEATAGAIRWIKTTGTGATGWRVSDGDTGWRDFSAHPNISGGYVRIRRINQSVFLYMSAVMTPFTGSGTLLALPPGFRPKNFEYFETPVYWNTDTRERLRVHTSGEVQAVGLSIGHRMNANIMFAPHESLIWPTSLPGAPA